jgi:small nuclear ribonucleoprotein E
MVASLTPTNPTQQTTRIQKVMVQPINLIFRYLQQKSRVQVWLYEQTDIRIEGVILGFDEFMNLVLDDAQELSKKKESRTAVGRILLRGENIRYVGSVWGVNTW